MGSMQWSPLVLLCLVVIGCGGGGNGSSPSSGPAQTSNFGPVSLEGFVYADPVRASGSGTSIVGLAGDFRSIVYQNPNPRIEQTQFVFSEGGGIHVVDYDGGNPRQIVSGIEPTSLSFSPGGGIVYFSDTNKNLRSVGITGGAVATLGSGEREFGTINPAGNSIVYYRRINANSVRTYVCNADGTGEALRAAVNAGYPLNFNGLAWVGNGQFL